MFDLDLKMLCNAPLKAVNHGRCVAIVEAFVIDDHVGFQDWQSGRDLCDMQIVDRLNMRKLENVGAD